MNSKKAKQLRQEAKKFSTTFGFTTQEIYKQLKKTSKGMPIKNNVEQ